MTSSVGSAFASVPELARARILGGAEVVDALARARDAAWETVPKPILEFVRLRLATLLGCQSELDRRTPLVGLDERKVRSLAAWPTSPLFSSAEQACLRLAEQLVVDVSMVTDEDPRAVEDALGPAGLYGFVLALVLIDQTLRARSAIAALFPEDREEP